MLDDEEGEGEGEGERKEGRGKERGVICLRYQIRKVTSRNHSRVNQIQSARESKQASRLEMKKPGRLTRSS